MDYVERRQVQFPHHFITHISPPTYCTAIDDRRKEPQKALKGEERRREAKSVHTVTVVAINIAVTVNVNRQQTQQ